jgi:hypothetical protein
MRSTVTLSPIPTTSIGRRASISITTINNSTTITITTASRQQPSAAQQQHPTGEDSVGYHLKHIITIWQLPIHLPTWEFITLV